MAVDRPIMPGARLGMLGGGQLGRMFTVAARTMGYRVLVLDPDPDSPAGAMANEHVHAGYLETTALDRLATECAAVSTEFENVPADALARLARHCIVRPARDAVSPTQNRLREKAFFDSHGLPTVPWAGVSSPVDLKSALTAVGTPSLLKHARGGYDGKGQARVDFPEAAADAFTALGEAECILERRVTLARELSVIVCRASDGAVACYPPGENVHAGGILSTTMLPATVDPAMAERARAIAAATAEALGYVGVLGVELFVTDDDDILVNEVAPRPHNSGHYTLDASATTQFEQQVRLLCGFGPGATDLLSPVAMVNLLGDLWRDGDPEWSRAFATPGANLHLYGKREPRPGRKMGHINVLATDAATALQRARAVHAELAGN